MVIINLYRENNRPNVLQDEIGKGNEINGFEDTCIVKGRVRILFYFRIC